MKAIGGETILFTREATLDGAGDPVPGTAVERSIAGCASWPASTSEEGWRGADVTDNRTALVPVIPSELGSNWTAELDGRTYNVEGLPQGWKTIRGELLGTQIKLKYQGGGNA